MIGEKTRSTVTTKLEGSTVSGLAQLAQKHQDGKGELQPLPVPEDIARESEVASEPEDEDRQRDHDSNAPGSQNVRELSAAPGRFWDGIVHGRILPWPGSSKGSRLRS